MEEKIIRAFCGALGIDASEFIATLKGEKDTLEFTDATLGELSAAAKTQVLAAKGETEKRFTRVAYDKYRKAMKSNGFDLPEGVTDPTELITSFAEFKAGSGGDGSGDLTKETALKNPIVKQILDERLKAASDEISAERKKHEDYVKTESLVILKSIGEAKAAAILRDKKAILETDTVKEADRLAHIYKMLPWDQMRLENGEPVLVDAETGDVLKDAFGKPVPFEKKVIEVGGVFGFHKTDPSNGGSGGGRSNAESQPGKKYKFADEAAYNTAYSRATDAAERAQMSKDFFGE